MTFDTLPGVGYCVTAKTDATVTDGNGLSLSVDAGAQAVFVASGSGVEYDPEACTIVQVRGNFNMPSAGSGGGGQPVAPVPEPLGTTTTLLHGHVYTRAVAEDTDLSALSVAQYATCELWLDYTAGSVTWPTLYWLDGTSSDAQHDHDVPPDMSAVGRYRVTLRNEGSGVTYANVAYSSAIPTPAAP